MKIDTSWNPLPTQSEVYYDDETETLLFSGGLGSGKSHMLVKKAIRLSILNRNLPGGFLVPSYSDFRRDIKPLFQDILEEEMGLRQKVHWDFHNTHKEFSFVWSSKPLYLFTAENPIAGPNLAYCLINEYSLMKYERVQEMLRRVRLKDVPNLQKILAGTPEDLYGWLEDFIEAQEETGKFKIHFADTSENHHIDETYREHLESMLDEQSLKVFASGQIIKLGGKYFYYSFDRNVNIRPCKYLPGQTIHVGMDFNVAFMACTLSHKIWNEDMKYFEQHFFDEIILKDSDTEKLGKAILNRYPVEDCVITCDASGKARKTSGTTDVKILEKLGFTVRFSKSNPRIRERQVLVNGLLYHGRMLFDPKMKKTIKDMEKVQQEPSDFSKNKKIDPQLTHLSDGVDYLMNWEYQIKDRRTKTIQL